MQTYALGLIPYWAKDLAIGNRMINARAETLTEKPAFKHLVGSRRCIIPADGFYEWRKERRRKVPMWVHLKGGEPFGLAGLWDVWRKPDGTPVESFTIITMEPNELVRPVHDRMPVILRPIPKESHSRESHGVIDRTRSHRASLGTNACNCGVTTTDTFSRRTSRPASPWGDSQERS